MNYEQSRRLLETEEAISPPSPDTFVRSLEVSRDARIGANVQFGSGVKICEGVEIADGVRIGDRVTLRNCKLGGGVRIEDNSIVGYSTLTGGFSHTFAECREISPTLIGEESLVRTGTVIYQAVSVGRNCWINHSVLLREHTKIGDYSSIGTMTDSEGYNTIGSHVSVHSQVQLCARILIEDYVFIAPMTVFANGSPMNYAREFESVEEGGIVRFGAQIAVNCVIMPRVVVGYESVIGPSSLVNSDVPNLTMAMGYPARALKRIPPEQRMPLELRRQYYGGADDPPEA